MKLAGRVALAALSLLAGCVHVPVEVADGLTFPQRQAYLAGIANWSMRGRIAVAAGEEGFSGRFSWTQRDEALDLRIRGPLGSGAMAIQGDPQQLTVTSRGATEPLSMAEPERELRAVLGWWVPVNSVPAWLLGIPDADYPAAESFQADGLLASFEQRGWQVRLQRYQIAENVLIPARLQLEHRELTLKVIIDSWAVDELD